MKISFVAPLNMSGGSLVIALYAQRLAARGHEVTICPGLKETLFRPPSHFNGRGLKIRSSVPDGDVVIATWWGTAPYVAGLPKRKGAKFYFVQHHEVHDYLPKDAVRATYQMPLHKIVVAQWLADVMRDEYKSDAVVVPNSVEHERFFASPRSKQDTPTVGLLYSPAPWKGVSVALKAVEQLRTALPQVRVRAFGLERPHQWPDFASFELSPPQDSLRNIYAACDVWLTASRSEGFNLPAMEAMACRTPVVSTRTGWPAEAIRSGENGALVEVDDVDAISRELAKILKLPDREWRHMSERAYETVKDSSWDRSTALLEDALVTGARNGTRAQLRS
jgi:glycosyltransferase involved in cell wall biosynthesis